MNMVLVPGFMADASLWDDVVPVLRRIGPISHADLSAIASIMEMAHGVLAKAPARLSVIGFSMGGYVVREMARIAPERVQALVLVATSARADTPEQSQRKMAAVGLLTDANFTGLSRKIVVSSLHPDHAANEAMIERIQAMSRRLGREAFMRQATLMRESDLDRLDEIRCPTLIIAAGHDRLRSLQEARELQQGIPSADFEIIQASGHMVPIEAPIQFSAIVTAWLGKIAAS